MNNKEKLGVAVAILLIVGISLSIGYYKGTEDTIKFGVKFAKQFTTIEFDEQMIRNGIMQYRDNINNCLFMENVSLG